VAASRKRRQSCRSFALKIAPASVAPGPIWLAVFLQPLQEAQHAVAMSSVLRTPTHVVIVDELGVRGRLARGLEGNVDDLGAQIFREHRVPHLARFWIDGFVDDIPGEDALAVAAADGGDVLAQETLRFDMRAGAEVVIRDPGRKPLRHVPEKGVAANGQSVFFCKGDEDVRAAKVEFCRRRPEHIPFEFVLGDHQAALCNRQRTNIRIVEGFRTRALEGRRGRGAARARAETAAEHQASGFGQSIQRCVGRTRGARSKRRQSERQIFAASVQQLPLLRRSKNRPDFSLAFRAR